MRDQHAYDRHASRLLRGDMGGHKEQPASNEQLAAIHWVT
jgi:hypothetical protein